MVDSALRASLVSIGRSFQSVQSVSMFAFIFLFLEAIAIPGQKGAASSALVTLLVATLAYGVVGLVLGWLGRRACLAPSDTNLQLLRVVSWLSLLHLPFGTVAGVRALWALRKR